MKVSGKNKPVGSVVSTVIRIHEEAGVGKLRRAVQSLYAQVGVRCSPIVVAHGFSEAAEVRLREVLAEEAFFPWVDKPEVINVKQDVELDIRSKLLNVGVGRHFELGNRFLSFLDFDDVLYSHAFATLTKPLFEGDAAFAFGGIELAQVVPFHDYDFVYSMSRPYKGVGKIDLLRDNFCPLHSYVVDTSKLNRDDVRFDEMLTRLEDYEFLLRVAGRVPCDFSNLSIFIGAYFQRSDGSNSTPSGDKTELDLRKEKIWDINRSHLKRLRSSHEIKLFASDF